MRDDFDSRLVPAVYIALGFAVIAALIGVIFL
jgi:hypothetical protein